MVPQSSKLFHPRSGGERYVMEHEQVLLEMVEEEKRYFGICYEEKI